MQPYLDLAKITTPAEFAEAVRLIAGKDLATSGGGSSDGSDGPPPEHAGRNRNRSSVFAARLPGDQRRFSARLSLATPPSKHATFAPDVG